MTGTPRLAIDMDPAEWGRKEASYEGARDAAVLALTFAWTVVEPNWSPQGIAVLADSLALGGGSIVSAATGEAAALGHTGLGHDPAHKVDWRPALSVADARAREGVDEAVVFEVSLDRAFTTASHRVDALDEAEQAVRAIYHGQGWRVGAERYMQLPSWLACLPMGSAGGLDADLERMGRMKTLLTSSAVNLAPLHGEWRGQPANPDNPPALFLIGRRGQPACWSPFANEAGNYNVAVTGKSGSGKSVLMQELVTGLIGAGGEAVVIDDGRSFQHTAEALDGAFIAFGKDPACLNPFAMIDAGTAAHDGDYREECFAMLAGVIGRMARRRGSIDDIEAALIAEAIAAAWDEAGNEADLGTVRKNLEARDDRRAADMATSLGPWCPGGAMGRLFAGSQRASPGDGALHWTQRPFARRSAYRRRRAAYSASRSRRSSLATRQGAQ